MKLKINGVDYGNVKRLKSEKTMTFVGESLRGLESVEGVIFVYNDNGFLMQQVDPANYLRTIVNTNSIQLTNVPANFVPAPTVEERVTTLETEAAKYSDLAGAFTEGVESIDE